MNARLAQRIGFTAWAALALLQVAWHGWLFAPATVPVAAALAIALVPLALPLAYWRQPQRALLAAGMVGRLYFCHGVAEAFAATAARPLAWIEIGLTVGLVLSCARKPRRRKAIGN
jgi:uncharacterized membrane protein